MTENKRYTKEYFDEYNKEYDFIEEDILTIFDNVSNKKYFMEFADDDEMNNTIDELINRLNEQEELIKRLKTIREEQTETILKQKRKIKELTTQLQTDDVCTKCKHHYLINYPESSKYYISKCKKEHEECSKEDIKFCEDFKLKDDVE